MDSYYQPPPQRADLWINSLQNNSNGIIDINPNQQKLIAETEARSKSIIPAKFHSDWSIYAGNISNIESVAFQQKDYVSGSSKI